VSNIDSVGKDDGSRAIYTAAVLCVLSVFIGAFSLVQLHGRLADAEKTIADFDAKLDRYYTTIQRERTADRKDYAGRIARLEGAVGIAEPWTNEMADRYLRSGGH